MSKMFLTNLEHVETLLDVPNTLRKPNKKWQSAFVAIYCSSFSENLKETEQGLGKDDQTIHVHQKGPPQVVLALCSHYYEIDGTVKPIDIEARTKLEHVIQVIAHDGFKSCAFAHKQLEKDDFDDMESHLQQQDGSLTLLGMMGVRDQIRPGVRKAIDDCKQAGVNVKVITGEDVLTAEAIASECGILGDPNEDIDGELVVEAFEFQNYSAEERMDKVDKIREMAGASYSDRLLFVECLKQNKGNVVAVTGNGPWDAPILLEADVGVFLGFLGNNAAVENSDIVILNKGFESVATVLKVGRGSYENVQTFIQYLLTANIASLVSDIVSTVSGPAPPLLSIVAAVSVEVPYAVLRMLWVKLIIGTLAALSLIIEKPTEKLMQKPPLRPEEPLITNRMCRSIMIHAVFQISVILTIQFKAQSLFAVSAEVMDMLLFNTFVLFQIFTVSNARKLEKDFLRGIRNKLYWGLFW
ncbi:Calcium-transporting ATPase [Quillaja saponaria]|uniref:Calcium-transporting ATPase n=1 Tax=Quillaja saponaria TaxID=32244 RepID=A0AAD7PH20_QUISA|nr:Calcium-transporting ATPase [Quillaja saponaria]